MSVITLAIPSKGRLMEATAELLAKAGFSIDRLGADRGYRGMLRGLDGVEIAFLSASEIAQNLRDGKVDLGVTGQDLLQEKIPPEDRAVQLLVRLGLAQHPERECRSRSGSPDQRQRMCGDLP